jgi:hypothetical protein
MGFIEGYKQRGVFLMQADIRFCYWLAWSLGWQKRQIYEKTSMGNSETVNIIRKIKGPKELLLNSIRKCAAVNPS